MKRSPAPMSMRCWMAASLAMRLPWLTITPLGAEVEPEVYCRKAMSSAAGAWGRQASASARSTWSAATAAMPAKRASAPGRRSEEHTSELQSQSNLVCRLLLEKKKKNKMKKNTNEVESYTQLNEYVMLETKHKATRTQAASSENMIITDQHTRSVISNG